MQANSWIKLSAQVQQRTSEVIIKGEVRTL